MHEVPKEARHIQRISSHILPRTPPDPASLTSVVRPLEVGTVSNVILKGDEAIHYAAVHKMTLNKGAEGSTGAQSGLSVEQASEVARVNPGLIWVEAHIKLNSADPSEQE